MKRCAVTLGTFCLLVLTGVIDATAQCNPPMRGPLGPRPGSVLRYVFASGFSAQEKQYIEMAIQQWNAASHLVGQKVTIEPWQSGQPGATVSFAKSATLTLPDGTVCTNCPGGMGSASYSPDGFITGFGIQFTTNQNILSNPIAFGKVALHEIGHAYGLADQFGSNGSSVMNQFVGPNDGGGAIPTSGVPTCDAHGAWVASGSPRWGPDEEGGAPGSTAGCPPGGCAAPGMYCPLGGCTSFGGYDCMPGRYYERGSGYCLGAVDGFFFYQYGGSGILPLVNIASPTHGSSVPSGAVSVNVKALDPDGAVTEVRYYVNGHHQYSNYSQPFTWNPTTVPPGAYTLQALAIDNQGYYQWSSPVSVTVVSGGGGCGGCGPDEMAPGERLYAGQYVDSLAGYYRLSYQTDGNLVLYGPGGPVWASMTSGAPGYVEMQADGNLVIYNSSVTPIWHSATSGNFGASLKVQDDGRIVIYNSGSIPIWAEP